MTRGRLAATTTLEVAASSLATSDQVSDQVSDDLLMRTEYRGPPWDVSVLDHIELVYEDGVPMETRRHRLQMELFIDVVCQAMRAQQRTNYFADGNMFVYYSPEQAHFVATHKPPEYKAFVGPDFFFVDQPLVQEREVWTVWEEGGRYPDIIVELLSPSTAHIDRGIKKTRYAEIFGTPEYYLYKPSSSVFTSFQLERDKYRDVEPDERGFVYSGKLQSWLGLWRGTFRGVSSIWLRLYDSQGELISTTEESRDTERQRAEQAEDRAEQAKDRAEQAEDRAEQAKDRAEQAEDRAEQAEQQLESATAEILRLRALLGMDNA